MPKSALSAKAVLLLDRARTAEYIGWPALLESWARDAEREGVPSEQLPRRLSGWAPSHACPAFARFGRTVAPASTVAHTKPQRVAQAPQITVMPIEPHLEVLVVYGTWRNATAQEIAARQDATVRALEAVCHGT